jgi:hypothetical protein
MAKLSTSQLWALSEIRDSGGCLEAPIAIDLWELSGSLHRDIVPGPLLPEHVEAWGANTLRPQ